MSRYQKELEDYSVTNELTGLFHRRAFLEKLPEFMSLSNRCIDIVVVTLDLDFLKQMNDFFGHEMGRQSTY